MIRSSSLSPPEQTLPSIIDVCFRFSNKIIGKCCPYDALDLLCQGQDLSRRLLVRPELQILASHDCEIGGLDQIQRRPQEYQLS